MFVALWRDYAGVVHLMSGERHEELENPPVPIHDALPLLFPLLVYLVPPPSNGSMRWQLLLEPTLPPDWQTLDWEMQLFHGQPLGEQALVVRRARWPGLEKAKQDFSAPHARLLDLFPKKEHDFFSGLQPVLGTGQLKPLRLGFADRQLACDELFVVAHGKALGLLDEQGQPFELPWMQPMPERVWLLACNVDAAMDRLAQSLLNAQSRCVIVASGPISAPAIQQLILDWYAAGTQDPVTWLASQNDATPGGIRTLRVWGEAHPDTSGAARWNRIVWDEAHEQAPAYSLDNETTRADFDAAYVQWQAKTLWSLAQKELTPRLLWLAEKHDHRAMQQLQPHLKADSPAEARSLAGVARRLGNYPQAAQFLSRPLGKNHNLPVQEHSRLLRLYANLLLDLDLPQAAHTAQEQQADLVFSDTAQHAEEAYRQLDLRARTAGRRGQFGVALDHLFTKQCDPRAGDGQRELAAQLYLAAWSRHTPQAVTTGSELLTQALPQLNQLAPAAIGPGNDTGAYLLRAVAAWAWASGDTQAQVAVRRWLPFIATRLADLDPGPWAYSAWFLHFLQSGDLCARASAALQRAHYHLEAAMFLGLAGQHEDAHKGWQRYDERRALTLKQLTPNLAQQSKEEALVRAPIERTALRDPRAMAQYGTFPL